MKQILIISISFLSIVNGISQDYMEELAKEACKCFDNVSDTLDIQKYTLELGLCWIDVSTPYKKQLKKDYDIDLDDIDTDGQKLGGIIAVKMGSYCSDALLKFANKVNGGKKSEENEKTIVGMVLKIENDFFITFSLKDNFGKITKYYWLTFIDSELELENTYNSLIDKSVKITYRVQEFFDPKIAEYRQFYIVSKIELVKN